MSHSGTTEWMLMPCLPEQFGPRHEAVFKGFMD